MLIFENQNGGEKSLEWIGGIGRREGPSRDSYGAERRIGLSIGAQPRVVVVGVSVPPTNWSTVVTVLAMNTSGCACCPIGERVSKRNGRKRSHRLNGAKRRALGLPVGWILFEAVWMKPMSRWSATRRGAAITQQQLARRHLTHLLQQRGQDGDKCARGELMLFALEGQRQQVETEKQLLSRYGMIDRVRLVLGRCSSPCFCLSFCLSICLAGFLPVFLSCLPLAAQQEEEARSMSEQLSVRAPANTSSSGGQTSG